MEQGQKTLFGNARFWRNPLRQSGGQAVVEYILMLVILISLVLGAKKAFSNVNDFMSDYMGDYIACLMEYGELPSLGIGEAGLNKHTGTCDANFSDFTFTGGVAYTGGGGGDDDGDGSGPGGGDGDGGGTGTGTSGGKGKSGFSSSKNSSRNAKNDSSDTDGSNSSSGKKGSGSDGASGGKNAGRRKSPYSDGRLKRSSSPYGTADGLNAGDGKVSVIDDAGDEDGSGGKKRRNRRRGRYRGNRYVYDRNKYRAITGAMAAEIEKAQPRPRRAPAATVKKLDEEGGRLGPYKKAFTPPEKKREVAQESDESGFSFGNIFKWLLIAAMIIAIVIFFGGQVLNYSNSQD